MRLLNIVIANVNFLVHCNDAPLLAEPLTAPYAPFIADATIRDAGSFAIDVILETETFPPAGELTEVFEGKGSWSMYKKGEEYYLALNPSLADGPECIARFGPFFERVIIYCGKMDIVEGEGGKRVRNPFTYPLDQLLLMYALAWREGALFHAAGVEMYGKGYLFPGRSGAGKSTLATRFIEAIKGEVLSDDRVAVRKIGNAFSMFGTPWPGEAGAALNKGAPLCGLFFVSHGSDNRIRDLDRREALERLLPVTSIPWYDRTVMAKSLDFCDDLCSHIPSYELSFRPDSEVVHFIEEFASK